MTPSKKPLQEQLRRLLRQEFATEGACATKLAELTGSHRSNVRAALRLMADVYIDRWEPTAIEGHFRAVYCAVEVPADWPHPTEEAA